jgi:hypothetical protein
VPNGADVTGEWNNSRYEDISYCCSSANVIRVKESSTMRWAGCVARMGEWRGVCKMLVVKPEEKRPLVRPRRRWEDNIAIVRCVTSFTVLPHGTKIP